MPHVGQMVPISWRIPGRSQCSTVAMMWDAAPIIGDAEAFSGALDWRVCDPPVHRTMPTAAADG